MRTYIKAILLSLVLIASPAFAADKSAAIQNTFIVTNNSMVKCNVAMNKFIDGGYYQSQLEVADNDCAAAIFGFHLMIMWGDEDILIWANSLSAADRKVVVQKMEAWYPTWDRISVMMKRYATPKIREVIEFIPENNGRPTFI